MSRSKPAYRIVSERLAYWYLFRPRSFAITLEQLAELFYELDRPVHLGSSYPQSDKRKQVNELLSHLVAIHKATGKGGTNEGL